MSRVLISGAGGYIGSALVKEYKDLVSVSRSATSIVGSKKHLQIPSFTELEGLSSDLALVKCVVHLAAIAHRPSTSIEQLNRVNVVGSVNLARLAIKCGVKRFIFVSSIGVNGLFSEIPFTVFDTPNPVEPYAQSKLEAEIALKELCHNSGMELVIIRPPLVYGPNAPGNFGALQKLLLSGLPLPLGAVNNQRSLVALDNLVDLIITCFDNPAAANQTFLVSDDDDVSTTELLRRMAQAFGKKQLLLPLPKWAMAMPAKLLGKQAAVDRLFGSLQVDITHTKNTLGWQPPVTMQQQLSKIASSLTNK